LVCNAAVYFPNAHKEGVFLPGLFPGGGPRWSAEGPILLEDGWNLEMNGTLMKKWHLE